MGFSRGNPQRRAAAQFSAAAAGLRAVLGLAAAAAGPSVLGLTNTSHQAGGRWKASSTPCETDLLHSQLDRWSIPLRIYLLRKEPRDRAGNTSVQITAQALHD